MKDALRAILVYALFLLFVAGMFALYNNGELHSEIDSLNAENENLRQSIETLRESFDKRYQQGYDAGYEDGKSDSYSSSYSDSSSYDDSYSYTSVVYITETGSKYHQSWCGYLRESSIEVSLSDAQSWGYDACSRCW